MKTDYSFWPASLHTSTQRVIVQDASSLPRPSYELDDDEEEDTPTFANSKPALVVYGLRDWSPKSASASDTTGDTVLDHDHVYSEMPKGQSGDDEVMIAPEEEAEHKDVKWKLEGVSEWVREFFRALIPYPIRHPRRFAQALTAAVARELRLHVKKSHGYFESRGVWLRTALHLPYFIIERRSALRFRLRAMPVS